MTLKIHKSNLFFEKFDSKSIKTHLKSLALWKSECLGSDPKLDPKFFTSQVGSGSKTRRKIGSGSRSEKIVSDPQHCRYRHVFVKCANSFYKFQMFAYAFIDFEYVTFDTLFNLRVIFFLIIFKKKKDAPETYSAGYRYWIAGRIFCSKFQCLVKCENKERN
jgi:hypothetical protein